MRFSVPVHTWQCLKKDIYRPMGSVNELLTSAKMAIVSIKNPDALFEYLNVNPDIEVIEQQGNTFKLMVNKSEQQVTLLNDFQTYGIAISSFEIRNLNLEELFIKLVRK